MAIDYSEFVSENSPSSAGFGVEGGKAVYKTLLFPADVDAALTDILGSVETDGFGGLTRSLPRAHPRWPWLYAARVSNILGLGVPDITPAIAPLESTTLPFFAEYERYLFTIDFEPLPFPVLADTEVDGGSLTWTDENGFDQLEFYANEDVRFTDWEFQPKPELLTAQQGKMAFYTSSGASPGAPNLAAGKTFPGFLQMVIPQRTIKCRWFRVPYSYVSSADSNLAAYVGRVNQIDWRGFPAGSLLYLGCSAKRYTPTLPGLVKDELTGKIVYANDKVCDIELNFLNTTRKGTDVPPANFIGNKNWVPAGFNLQPWLKDRNFYYTAGSGGITASPPTYFSVDFRLLFTDPDAG